MIVEDDPRIQTAFDELAFAEMWLHASPEPIDGGFVLPPSVTRVAPRRFGDELARAEALRHYSRACVYIFCSEGAPVTDHIGRFTFCDANSFIYEVEPIGTPERDPDPTAPPSSRCCRRARVIRCLHSPDA